MKRSAENQTSNVTKTKKSKFFDFTNISQNLSVLQTFYDFIDNEDYDIIDEYLTNNDFLDLLNYFRNQNAYKPKEFSLVFEACTKILMQIVGELSTKHSLSGQAFAESFFSSFNPTLYYFLTKNQSESRIMSCLKFITALILQSKDTAMKAATTINFTELNLSNLLSIRKLKQVEDVHSCVIELYSAFFIMESNSLIRKVCEEKILIGDILKDLRFDRFSNVQLIIEILHEKILKNISIPKTTKVKFFNTTNLRYLLSVYEWKRATISFDEFTKNTKADENCVEIYAQLHSFLIDLCSSHQNGIAFVDNLLSLSKFGNLNNKLHYFIKSESMRDYSKHKLKRELLLSILKACPDLINSFVEHLVALLVDRKPEYWKVIFQDILECYQQLSSERMNDILTEACTYNKGEKFMEIAQILCLPSKPLIELLHESDKINVSCGEEAISLRKTFIDTCEKVITWINVTDLFPSQKKKMSLLLVLEEALMEKYTKCQWEEQFKVLLSEELCDETIFTKAVAENETKRETMILDDPIDEEISKVVTILRNVNNGEEQIDGDGCKLLKKCYKFFLSSPSTSISLLKLICETLSTGRFTLKKKYKRLILEMLLAEDFFHENLTPVTPEDEFYLQREEKRNCILDMLVYLIQQSHELNTEFYSRIHPLQLLSIYEGSMSLSDQKILFLIELSRHSDIAFAPYNYILFGGSVNEHYTFSSEKPPRNLRPIITSQTLNLLENDRITATLNHFPISRINVVSENQTVVLSPSQPRIYDPYFLSQWLFQSLKINTNKPLEFGHGIDLKTLFSKQIFSILVACQASESRHIRLFSRLMLTRLLSVTMEAKADEFPVKENVESIISHFLATISDGDKYLKVSSIFTNYYIRMLQLVASPGKKVYSPLIEMMAFKEKFDLTYVPNFLRLLYSPDCHTRLLQLWILELLSHSIKSVDDYRILMNSQVFSYVLPIYVFSADQAIKSSILRIIENCVSIGAVAKKLYKFPGFVSWFTHQSIMVKDKVNRNSLKRVIEKFVSSLRSSKEKIANLDEFERVLRLFFPDMKLSICLSTD